MQDKRIEAIQQYISQHKICTYEELCQYCNASLSSVRRDINALEAKGLVIKSRGGVKLPPKQECSAQSWSLDLPVGYSDENAAAKDMIARKASELVKDGDVIFLGSGTTVSHMVKYIGDFHNLTVITNNINVLKNSYPYKFRVIMVGGILDRDTMSLTGIQTISQLKELNANKTFLSCNGIALPHGITNVSDVEADIKRTAIMIGSESVLLVDSNKFNKISLYTFAEMSDFSTVITEAEPDKAYLEQAQMSNTKIVVAKKEML